RNPSDTTPASTPNTVDDHGGRNRGKGGSGPGS
ncbi:MAG: hypothetical protein QOE62_1982, partial [Actinomycetota bacterium]|nr:hypothetical protein [Actinomycetota bacterium]